MSGQDNNFCVSFQRSLELLKQDNQCGAYGMSGGQCDHLWKRYIREGWLDALHAAEAEITRDLKMALCEREICGEVHNARNEIKTRQRPIAYLGTKTYTPWQTVALDNTTDGKEAVLTDTDLAGVSADQVEFTYPEEVLECYTGQQSLQEPCLITDTAPDPDEHHYSWVLCQLVRPDVDEANPTDVDNSSLILQEVQWRVWEIDESTAVEAIGYCDCQTCQAGNPYTATLCDSEQGVVCLSTTGCSNRQIRLNYATAFDCVNEMDPGLEQAVVLFAVVKAGKTPAKPCGCDNRYIDWLLEPDPTAASEFATKLRYGPTNAGMQVMRTMDNYLNTPHFNEPVESGGLFGGRGKSRKPTVLKGW